MNTKVTLISVLGESPEEFSDLIGAKGFLHPTTSADSEGSKESLTFRPDGRGDWLVMLVVSKEEKGDRLTIKTGLDNTFVFRLHPTG